MTRKSTSRRSRDNHTARTFLPDRAVEKTAYDVLRSKWGAHLTDAEIMARVASMSVEEREKLSGEVIANAVARGGSATQGNV